MEKRISQSFLVGLAAVLATASSSNASTRLLEVSELRSGDVLLQSLPCSICALIEQEESSAYSHAGIVAIAPGKTEILQALNGVERITLEAFLRQRRRATSVLVLRPIHPQGDSMGFDRIHRVFAEEFERLNYDPSFSWHDRDDRGERLYCSEFIAKFLNRFVESPLLPKPMHYRKNRDAWIRYFGGNPPDGEPGISPGDLERDPGLLPIGFLEIRL